MKSLRHIEICSFRKIRHLNFPEHRTYLIIEGVVVVELRADLGDEREVLETRELASRHGEDTWRNSLTNKWQNG